MKVILTCEHAGNRVPLEYKYLFEKDPGVLDTHRGYDPGAFDLFQSLKVLATYNRVQLESRLLIEVNRSLHHPHLFSEFTCDLPGEIKQKLVDDYYKRYREDVEKTISKLINVGEEVFHLSIHSFTPKLSGVVRNADIGLLYNPTRKTEKDFCKRLKKELLVKNNSYRIRANYPYRGTADGFTTSLRKSFPEKYAGVEIEVNQNFVFNNNMESGLKSDFLSSLKQLFNYQNKFSIL